MVMVLMRLLLLVGLGVVEGFKVGFAVVAGEGFGVLDGGVRVGIRVGMGSEDEEGVGIRVGMGSEDEEGEELRRTSAACLSLGVEGEAGTPMSMWFSM
jgi:hypothetical protein